MFKIIWNTLIQEQQIKFGLVAAILIKTPSHLRGLKPRIYRKEIYKDL
jgi:uncharacterized protein YwbE